MRSHDLKKAKRAVRREVLERRDALDPAERARRGRAAVERFLELPELQTAGLVMGFWSFGSEIPTEPLLLRLHEHGTRIALPRIVGGALQSRSYVPGDPVHATSFGAHEPVDGDLVDPGQIDVIAVPAVAFDREGARVGYGGGFYDRFLSLTRGDAARLGLAFDVQVVDGQLPAGPFDLRVDAVVTESETIRCRPGRSSRRST